MELINECTSRFADEKDYRLLVPLASDLESEPRLTSPRLSILLWHYFGLTIPVVES
jgi:hypothetical protein